MRPGPERASDHEITMTSPTHAIAVLFREGLPLESLHGMLRGVQGLGDVAPARDHVRVDTDAGVVCASTFGAPWPDDDEESLAELGGPAAGLFPAALARAGAQDALWPGGELAARAHQGFVHLVMAEATGGPLAQIEALERLGVALLSHPDALCVFFPAGESLRDGNIIGKIRAVSAEQEALPIQIWVNGRLADAGMGTRIADLVALAQIGLSDCEAVIPEGQRLAPFEVLGFLLDVTHHLASQGGALEDGVIYDGPGGLRWRAGLDADAQIDPPRKVVRWIPLSPDEAAS